MHTKPDQMGPQMSQINSGKGRGLFVGAVVLCGLLGACSSSSSDGTADLAGTSGDLAGAVGDLGPADLGKAGLSFFITSRSGSANLGGLAGADNICQTLAAAVGAGSRTWAAYLSTSTVNARDRIGQGPWYNAAGAKIADSVADLHSDKVNITKATGLDETGKQILGRGDTPNEHDILTGSNLDGTVNGSNHCVNWTNEAATGSSATVGHFDREGGGPNPMSWNSAHNSQGCSAAALVATGGAGRFYCFAR